MKSKKGNFNILSSLVINIGLIAIVLTATFIVLSQGRTQIGDVESLTNNIATNATECHKSLSCNGTMDIQMAVDDIPGWMPIIIIVMIGVALIGFVSLFKKRG